MDWNRYTVGFVVQFLWTKKKDLCIVEEEEAVIVSNIFFSLPDGASEVCQEWCEDVGVGGKCWHWQLDTAGEFPWDERFDVTEVEMCRKTLQQSLDNDVTY